MSKQSSSHSVPLFRSDGQASVLASLYLLDGRELSLTDLAADAGLSIATVHEEVERLERFGLLRSRRVGRTRLVSVDPGSFVAEDVGRLVRKFFGVEELLKAAFEAVDGVEQLVIFGSWAARRLGVDGLPPEDIDLLVVGDADLDDVYQACTEVETAVALPINPTVFSIDEWEADESGFARSVGERPSIVLKG